MSPSFPFSLAAASVPVAVALLSTPTARPDTELPPNDLVLQLRAARIATMAGDEQRGFEMIQKAVREYPKEVLPVLVMKAFILDRKLDPAQLEGIRDLLKQRLDDPEASLPAGTVTFLAGNPDLSAEDLLLLRGRVEVRLATAPADPELLEALALLQLRLGDAAGARVTFQRLLDVRPPKARSGSVSPSTGGWDGGTALSSSWRG